MSDSTNWTVVTDSAAATEAFGEELGRRLRGGEVFELASDLGGGKTTLVRGIARGAGSSDLVSSPTFTISQEYQAGGLRIYHFDFYRLAEAGIMAQELDEAFEDPSNVVLVEWSDIVHDVLPAERLVLSISRVASGEDDRRLTISVPVKYAYLMENLPDSVQAKEGTA